MANRRKRGPGRIPASEPVAYKIGDAVRVKPGVDEAVYGGDISGWQGRITEIYLRKKGRSTVMIAWDSRTLRAIQDAFIKNLERKGLGWDSMGVFVDQVERASARDSLMDVERAVEKISTRFQWAYLGAEGDRIQQVVHGAQDDLAALKAWAKHLRAHLKLPFEAEATEWIEEGPIRDGDSLVVNGLERTIVDDYGILAKVETKAGDFVYPLCDLKVRNRKSANSQLLNDYGVWFANRSGWR